MYSVCWIWPHGTKGATVSIRSLNSGGLEDVIGREALDMVNISPVGNIDKLLDNCSAQYILNLIDSCKE